MLVLVVAASSRLFVAVVTSNRRRVLRDETEMRLTPKGSELLSLLVRNHDRVLTHRAILKADGGANAVEQPEHLWTLVAQVRKKIEPDPGAPKYLVSEPWVGYRFVTEGGTPLTSATGSH
jgi:DNA-binding response OmpR family regulator